MQLEFQETAAVRVETLEGQELVSRVAELEMCDCRIEMMEVGDSKSQWVIHYRPTALLLEHERLMSFSKTPSQSPLVAPSNCNPDADHPF
jgi:hypothetical protein